MFILPEYVVLKLRRLVFGFFKGFIVIFNFDKNGWKNILAFQKNR